MKLPFYEEISHACTFLTITDVVKGSNQAIQTQTEYDKIFLLNHIIYSLYCNKASPLDSCKCVNSDVISCDITPDELTSLLDELFKKLKIS